jgi:hypothetical protein
LRLIPLSFALLTACHDPAPLPDQPHAQAPQAPSGPAIPAPPTADTSGDALDQRGAEAFDAVLEMDRLVGGKALQATYLTRGDVRYIVSYRKVPEYYQYVGKRVTVTGVSHQNGPNIQSVAGLHFTVQHIALAPGEQPYDPIPTSLPPAPRVDSLAAIKAQGGGWVELHGVVERWGVDEHNTSRGSLTLRLTDGAITSVSVHGTTAHKRGAALAKGQPATVTAYITDDEAGQPRLGRSVVCAGDVRGCGINDDTTR